MKLTNKQKARLDPSSAKKETSNNVNEKIAPTQDVADNDKIKRSKPYGREDKIQYIVDLYPFALAVSDETGLSLELMLAQAALETGWGGSVIPGSNNMYNIKADPGWHGAKTKPVKTREFRNGKWEIVYDRFRAYDNIEEGVKDRIQFLKENKRYSAVFQEGTKGHFLEEAKALLNATYATNPNYVQDLANVSKGPTMRTAIERARKKHG
ncbi:MAG: glucosaminidase domain-containing protein [Legionella sp.]|uniref:glycoside hydrolase family 73 protein n=1 Tax=Legionella sp. TaxID=459 RepID=UPI00283C46F9|nr:glucosaminidase domain-containing protein [Legionella sp.]